MPITSFHIQIGYGPWNYLYTCPTNLLSSWNRVYRALDTCMRDSAYARWSG